ncbi:hypothetical protein ACLB1M_00850 [Escherichia coli]
MNVFLNMSAWKEDYWDRSSEVGANLNLSKSFNNISVSLNAGYSKLQGMENDYNAGVSLSVPFSVFDKSHYSFSGRTMIAVTVPISTPVLLEISNSRLSYNASINQSRNTTGSAVSASYLFDVVQTSASYSQMGWNRSSSSFQVGGSIIGVPDAGIFFTPVKNDEIAVVQMEDVPGVRFNGSMPGDKKGRAVIPLTAYNNNTITVNANN